MSELARQSVAAAKWGLISSVGRFVLQLLVSVAVARLLGPEAYGLFALASIGLVIATFTSEVGLGWSLMQRPALDGQIIRFVFTWQCISGLMGCLFMWVGGPLFSELLRDPRLIEILRWLGLVCLLNGIGATATNLLRRELRFKALAKVQLLGYVLAYGLLGLPLAAWGAGVWALVTAWVAQAALCCVLAYSARPHELKPKLFVERPREFVDVGSAVLLTNICNLALTNLDRLLLGRLAGAHTAGLYAVGYNLATVPNGLLISALQPAFLASGARLQSDRSRMAKAYLEVQCFIWIVLAPLFALLAMSSGQIIAVLYGSAWRESGAVFAYLACAMPAYLACALTTPVLWNTGRKWLEIGLQLPILLMAVPAFYFASERGAASVAALAALVFGLRYLAMLMVACRALPDLTPKLLLAQTGRALLIIATVALPAMLVQHSTAGRGWPHWATGTCQLVTGVSLWLVLLLAWPKWLGAPALTLLGRFTPKGSAFGAAWKTRSGLL